MRRKYFMRGMGVGIIITSLIFTISFLFKDDKVSNAYIIERAKKLGMVMPGGETVKSKDEKAVNTEEETENSGDMVSENTTEAGDKVTVETLTGDDVTEPPKETTDSSIYTNKSKNTEEGTTKEKVNFSVKQGESSNIVSANLYKAGLVKNPTEFNKYLETNGYDQFIKVGDYSIKEGSSDKEIAKTITGQ